MYPRNFSPYHCRLPFFIVVVVLALAGSVLATTPVENVIYRFGFLDGEPPYGDLVADAAGNLYGTSGNGGANPGAVFELSPPVTAGGAWTETILYYFHGGPEGANPFGGVIFDKHGNLYGTTLGSQGNEGTFFELSPPSEAGGEWTETTLWAFNPDRSAGKQPSGKLVMDEDGNFYGTTVYGGTHDAGVVFEMVAPKTSGGPWAERVLHNFGAAAKDGNTPAGSLLLRGGVLYGTTMYGGAGKNGVVFQLVRKPGAWTETILHSFTGEDGSVPDGGLISDSEGNLYGAAAMGGKVWCGTIYELSPPAIAGGPWQQATLYRFTGGADGAYPSAALWRDASGNLYGTAYGDGAKGIYAGTAFKLKAPGVSGGEWTFAFLHTFGISSDTARYPSSALTFANGVLYGSTSSSTSGGTYGTVFSIVP